jgi:hypothetical protein
MFDRPERFLQVSHTDFAILSDVDLVHPIADFGIILFYLLIDLLDHLLDSFDQS